MGRIRELTQKTSVRISFALAFTITSSIFGAGWQVSDKVAALTANIKEDVKQGARIEKLDSVFVRHEVRDDARDTANSAILLRIEKSQEEMSKDIRYIMRHIPHQP